MVKLAATALTLYKLRWCKEVALDQRSLRLQQSNFTKQLLRRCLRNYLEAFGPLQFDQSRSRRALEHLDAKP